MKYQPKNQENTMSTTTTEDLETTEETPVEESTAEVTEQHQETTEDSEQDQEQEGSTDDQESGSKASRQAARYRRQLRDTEAERDELKAQVDTLRRSIAEEALAGVLAKPSALWLTGAEPSSFYDEHGNLDTDALTIAAKEAASESGLQTFKRFQGSADGGAKGTSPAPRRFADMFRPDKAHV